MGFLWSDIEMRMHPETFRYYNDLVWYCYSMIGLVPLLVITIYKFFFKPIKEIKERTWDDLITLPIICYGPVYYTIDGLISIWENNFLEPCRFSLWYHHIVILFSLSKKIAVLILPSLLQKNAIFWYETAVWLSHAFVVYDSEQMISLILYVMAVAYFNFQLYRKDFKCYTFLGKFFPLLYYCFVQIIYHDCYHPLPYL